MWGAPLFWTLIDIGCGAGNLLYLLKKCGKPSWNPIGNDIDVSAARTIQNQGIQFVDGRIEEVIDSLSESNMAILNQTIEYLENPGAVIDAVL
ncbi:MAG: methionine biosynthesis protein MetW [Gemmatimonadota bacterium]|nr:methionine biosynthesis protein MetW [Gemmatimonadota bacterium]